MKQYQQGDVNIRGIEAVPEGATEVKPEGGKFLIRSGESGNSHVLETVPGMKVFEKDDIKYVVPVQEISLQHIGPSCHHDVQTLDPKEAAVWECSPVYEEDHLKKMVRPVVD